MKGGALRTRLLDLVDRFEAVRVLAFVDLVADEYIYGRIASVSREAPVLILSYDGTQIVPGGGANAVMNIAALGGKPFTVGMVGKDGAGRELLKVFRKARIDVSTIERDPAYRTPTKTRILAGGIHSTKQQVVRIDRETQVDSDGRVGGYLERCLAENLPRVDVVMVSDYGYGLISPEFGLSLAKRTASIGKPAIVDSRFDILSYPGFTSATPNEPEVEAALGVTIGDDESLLERSGRQILRRLRGRAVVITRGSKGRADGAFRIETAHTSHSSFWDGRGGGCDGGGGYGHQHVQPGARCRSHVPRGGASGQLRGRDRGHEAGDGHGLTSGTVGGGGLGSRGVNWERGSTWGPLVTSRRRRAGRASVWFWPTVVSTCYMSGTSATFRGPRRKGIS